MNKWEIKKNRLDMEYQQILQKYQVFLAAKFGVPVAILGIFMQAAPQADGFLLGALFSYLVYIFLVDKINRIEKDIANIKRKVSML